MSDAALRRVIYEALEDFADEPTDPVAQRRIDKLAEVVVFLAERLPEVDKHALVTMLKA